MDNRTHRLGEDGIALITTLLVVLVAGALITGAVILGSNHMMIDRYWSRQSNLVTMADAGLEEGRALLNGDKSFFPDTAYLTLESGSQVQDGEGNVIPGVQRSTYVGPTGITSGQYGVYGSVISVVEDDGGGVAIRRQQIYQESFAKFAYFTDSEGGNIYFGGGDQIWGPLHTNDQIKVHSSRATFWDEVTTAKDIYQEQYGTFAKGYSEYSPVIPMPETAELVKLKVQAVAGGTSFTGNANGAVGEATTRIEFVALDLNNDGDTTDEDEGFIRVYKSTDWDWVSAKTPVVTYCSEFRNNGNCRTWSTGPDLRASAQCGDYHGSAFVAAASHPLDGHDAATALRSSSRVCYLGGDPRIFGGFQSSDTKGAWLPWTGAVDSRVQNRYPLEAGYLFPINRPLNPDFKGVIYVEGKVLVSGVIRGQVTVAATGHIIFGDDITYATNAGAGSCADMAGYFSGDSIVISNNLLNAPAQTPGSSTWRTYDETTGEFIDGVVLALGSFTAEGFNTGSSSAESCGSSSAGRGCIFLTGGIIQGTRGAVGITSGQGYVKRYSYDQCAANQPPPYFPTTGVFVEGQYYQVDPAGFNIAAYFRLIAPGSQGG